MTFTKNVVLFYPTPYGALTQLFAGTMPEALNYNGEVSFSLSCVFSLTQWSHVAVHDTLRSTRKV